MGHDLPAASLLTQLPQLLLVQSRRKTNTVAACIWAAPAGGLCLMSQSAFGCFKWLCCHSGRQPALGNVPALKKPCW